MFVMQRKMVHYDNQSQNYLLFKKSRKRPQVMNRKIQNQKKKQSKK